VAKAIDALSQNSDHQTKTMTEQAATANWMKQMADIGLIVGSIMGAVFFTLLLLTGNTMAQAVRERTSELAVLKTIGFSSTSVLLMVLAESVLLVMLGGLVGVALSIVIGSGASAASGGMINIPPLGWDGWVTAIGLMIAIGLLVGALPAIRGMRLNIVEALAGREGDTRVNKIKGFLRGRLMGLVVVVGVACWLALPWFVLLALVVLFGIWMLATRRGRQAGSVTQVGLSTLRQRIGASSVVVIGIAGVVAVLVAMLAMAEGYRETLRKSGSEDTAIVMRGASASEVMSTLDNASVLVLQQAPGIARDAEGKPIAPADS